MLLTVSFTVRSDCCIAVSLLPVLRKWAMSVLFLMWGSVRLLF
jgi:hypothetical protein